MNLSELHTSKNLETAGIWAAFMGAEFLVAAANNPKYQRAIRRLTQGLPAAKLKDPATIDPLISKAMAETILLDFRGEVKNGTQELTPTPESRLLLCQNRVFAEWLATVSNDFTNYQEGQKDAEIADLKSESRVDA